MKAAGAALVALAGCGFGELSPAPPAPRPVEERFVVTGEAAEDVAVMPGGDLVVVGCEERATFVTRIDHTTWRAAWTRRAASPCGQVDNWTVPRVAVSTAGTIWVAAYGWGRGPYGERDRTPMALLAFDGAGGLGAQRELPVGERVRAMAALVDGRVAIAGQSATVHDRSSAFVAAIGDDAGPVWRHELAGPAITLIDSLAVDGDRLLVGASVDGTLEDLDAPAVGGREGDGLIVTLDGAGRPLTSEVRHYPGVNVSDVQVAVAGGRRFVAWKLGLRRGHPWPDALPPVAPSAPYGGVLVEPLAPDPAWRRLLTGTNHVSVEHLAASPDRVAVELIVQAGEVDFGAGVWRGDFFTLAAHVELAAADGTTVEARSLVTSGDGARSFPRRAVWDGAAFTVVGELRGLLAEPALDAGRGSGFVWRVGVTRVAGVGGVWVRRAG